MLSMKATASGIPPLFLKLSDTFSAACLNFLSLVTLVTAFRISSSSMDQSLSPAPSSSVLKATAPCSVVCGKRISGTPKYSPSEAEFMPQWVMKASEISSLSNTTYF